MIGKLILVLALAIVAAPFAGAPLAADAATLDTLESELLAQINQFRGSRGLARLALSDTLSNAAQWMATDMATRNYFSHTSLDGRTPQQRMADAGYPAYTTWTGEDLAAGYTDASRVLQGWINSPAHYAVLTNPSYRAIGLGRAYGSSSQYGWYWSADFGGVVDGATVSLAPAPAPAVPTDLGYHAAYAGQSAHVTLAAGQVTTLTVGLLNTGYRGWYAGVPGQQANLGTKEPQDVARYDLAYGWPSANRPATQTSAYVGPGQVGWFQFQVRAPAAPGTYRLRVAGVIEGTTWLEDMGIYFNIEVQ